MSTKEQIAAMAQPADPKLRMREWVQVARRRSLVLSGSLVMLVGTVLVSAINFGYNVAMARMLGPAEFGNVSAVATLLMLLSALSLSFQLVTAKFVARNQGAFGKDLVYRRLMRRAAAIGIISGIALCLLSEPLAYLLHLPSALLIVFLALGFAFSVPLGVKRGGFQGICAFGSLTGNFILEATVKFGLAALLVGMGYGAFGAVGAISASVVAAFVFSPIWLGAGGEECRIVPASFREGMQAIVFFVGQVVINNIDILLVKSFFSAADAGLYAAVALFGRLLYFASWSIVSAMFPISAATHPNQNRERVLLASLLLVIGVSLLFIVALEVLPDFVVALVLGESFAKVSSLLSLYALATAFYSVSVVLMAYEMSHKIANTGWFQLVVGGAMIIAISMFHDSLRQVIQVQIVMMVLLLTAVSLPFLRGWLRFNRRVEEAA
jgi:O-antigen/teichoic acid export membrane protein